MFKWIIKRLKLSLLSVEVWKMWIFEDGSQWMGIIPKFMV